MTEIFYIKNMVCDRCIASVKTIFNTENYTIKTIELGKVTALKVENNSAKKLTKALLKNGFEIIKNDSDALVEQLKTSVIQKIEVGETVELFIVLAKEFGKTKTSLSKLFSKHEGITLEKYTINLKIEKVKEFIQLGQLNFSEIAYTLNYKTSSHLAKQFKITTGLSMSDYKKLKNWDRKPLDKIV